MNRNRRDKMRASFPTFDMAFDRAMADFEDACFTLSRRLLDEWPTVIASLSRSVRIIEPLVLTHDARKVTR